MSGFYALERKSSDIAVHTRSGKLRDSSRRAANRVTSRIADALAGKLTESDEQTANP